MGAGERGRHEAAGPHPLLGGRPAVEGVGRAGRRAQLRGRGHSHGFQGAYGQAPASAQEISRFLGLWALLTTVMSGLLAPSGALNDCDGRFFGLWMGGTLITVAGGPLAP